MLEQIENQNLPAGPQNFMRAADGAGRLLRVMQCLAQNHEVNAAGINRRVLQIAQPEFQIFQPVLLRLRRAERDNLFRIVHGDDLLAAPRQQFAQQTFARTKIGHDQRRQDAQQQMPKRLP